MHRMTPEEARTETSRPWLDDAARAYLAKQFDCPVSEVDHRLDARAAMEARTREWIEYDDPYGYRRGMY